MHRTIAAFAIATLGPAFLLSVGALWGGAWAWLALGSVTLFAVALDSAAMIDDPIVDPSPRAAATLPLVLAAAHFVVLILCTLAVAGATLGEALSLPQRVALFFAAGLYMGQVSNSNAHELIHRPGWLQRKLGALIYTSLLFGHHASAHPAVHHRHVGTRNDPNTARLNESIYRFVPRAWAGSARAGLKIELRRLARSGRSGWHWRNPYWIYWLGGFAFLLGFALLGGVAAALVYVGLAAYATVQLLASDYVQHYGLQRRRYANGRFEPVGPQHSWNAPHWFSSMMMLNAPRHSDHHAKPGKTFQYLTLPEEGAAPQLPFSLPVMAAVALVPRAWKRLMNPRVRTWRDQLRREAA